MNITYKSWKSYKKCPKQFYKQYIKEDQPTVPINEYFTLYGRLTEKFFELYCNNWRRDKPILTPKEIKEKMIVLYKIILKASIVDWTAFYCKYSKEDIFSSAYSDVCNIMESVNRNYFLNTKSEIKIELTLNSGHSMKGRLDFLHKNPLKLNEISIFDGKGTDTIGKNINNDQLLFYALLYYFQFKLLPIELGFFYYRFNTLIPVAIDLEIINEFRASLSLDLKAMIKTPEYTATPSAKSCKYCNYANGCLEHLKDKATRVKPSKIKNLESDGDVIEFGLD